MFWPAWRRHDPPDFAASERQMKSRRRGTRLVLPHERMDVFGKVGFVTELLREAVGQICPKDLSFVQLRVTQIQGVDTLADGNYVLVECPKGARWGHYVSHLMCFQAEL